jgi:hypothetical protein
MGSSNVFRNATPKSLLVIPFRQAIENTVSGRTGRRNLYRLAGDHGGTEGSESGNL